MKKLRGRRFELAEELKIESVLGLEPDKISEEERLKFTLDENVTLDTPTRLRKPRRRKLNCSSMP